MVLDLDCFLVEKTLFVRIVVDFVAAVIFVEPGCEILRLRPGDGVFDDDKAAYLCVDSLN